MPEPKEPLCEHDTVAAMRFDRECFPILPVNPVRLDVPTGTP